MSENFPSRMICQILPCLENMAGVSLKFKAGGGGLLIFFSYEADVIVVGFIIIFYTSVLFQMLSYIAFPPLNSYICRFSSSQLNLA